MKFPFFRQLDSTSYTKRKHSVILLVVVCILVSSCRNETQTNTNIEEIDLYDAYIKRSEVPVSNIASEIEYIRLETGKDFMLGNPHLIDVKDSLILFIGFRQLYIFSRYTGKFLYEISGYGNGPDEYLGTNNIYDQDENLSFAYLQNKRKNQKKYDTYGGYNYEGFIQKIVNKPPSVFRDDYMFQITRFYPLDDSLYLGYANNLMGNCPQKLVIFNGKGEIQKSYPNYNAIEIEESESINQDPYKAMFFNVRDTIRFFELHTDTIFSVNIDNILPRYHILMGDLSLPYQLQAIRSAMRYEYLKYFYIRTMHESSRFLMFTVGINGFRHIAYYDKIQKKTVVCDTSNDLEFYNYEEYLGIRCIGFSNDLDQFVPIGTDKHFYINKNEEFVTAIPALEVKRWFDRNPEKVNDLSQQLRGFSDIKEEDNPIVIIGKLRK